VFDNDPLHTVGPSDDLEPERTLGALLEPAHDVVDVGVEWAPFELFGDLIDLQAQASADESDIAAPNLGVCR
jgi:hypothetical protein